MRRAARIDDNQNEIVKHLRDHGASVQILSMVGKGCPDILVGYTNAIGVRRTIVLEIKDGNKPPSQQRLTADEEKWFDTWKGDAAVVNSTLEVDFVMGWDPEIPYRP
tara:strand:- start:889 stop:1209 length:321 start_codon:yes stop_codon:yes gene_type:complete